MRCVCAANVPARMIAVDPNTAVFLGSRCLVSAERYRYLVTRAVVGFAKNATTADRNVSIYDTSTLFQTTRTHGSGCRLTCRLSLYLLVAFKHAHTQHTVVHPEAFMSSRPSAVQCLRSATLRTETRMRCILRKHSEALSFGWRLVNFWGIDCATGRCSTCRQSPRSTTSACLWK